MPITEIVGWVGMILVLVAYLLISFEKVTSKNSSYHFLNLFGVLGIGINVFVQKAWPVFALEFIWAIIAVISLVKIYLRKRRIEHLLRSGPYWPNPSSRPKHR